MVDPNCFRKSSDLSIKKWQMLWKGGMQYSNAIQIYLEFSHHKWKYKKIEKINQSENFLIILLTIEILNFASGRGNNT